MSYYSTQPKQKHSSLVSENRSRNAINHAVFLCSGVDVRSTHHVVTCTRCHAGVFRHIRPLINKEIENTSSCSIVCTRLDYCKSFLYGVTESSTYGSSPACSRHTFSHLLNAATPKSGLRNSLYWLPIRQHIIYRSSLTLKIRIRGQPVYFADLIVEHTLSRKLRSSGKDLFVVPGSRRNSLPGDSMSLFILRGTICQFTYGRPLPQTTSGNN